MSIRIPLHFKILKDPQLVKQGIDVNIIRLMALVKFQTTDGLVTSEAAIIDTGAPMSLMPHKIWKRCNVDLLGKLDLRGVIHKKECRLKCDMGEISLFLASENYLAEKVTVKAYFPKTDRVPLIIGFESLLEQFQLVVNYNKRIAFLAMVIV